MQLNAWAWGDPAASPVVCVHGITAHGRRFRRLAEERLADGYRAVAVDLRGHGSSTWEPPWDLETHVADLLETADAHGMTRAAWIGHGFGGRLVAEVVAREPGRVARAVLLDPAIRLDAQAAVDRAEAYLGDLSFASPEEALAARLGTGRFLSTPPEAWDEEVAQHLERGGDGRYRWRFSQLAVIAGYGELTTPGAPVPLRDVLVVLGERSWLKVPLPRIATIDVATVPGGHSVLWDDFDATAAAVRAFLDA
ncbi:MAG TPA: alpha/beta hydrolase [Gaiellaceae bacterium]|nr:alpha/beta hydrolase [Gaiellaceae bacterium]